MIAVEKSSHYETNLGRIPSAWQTCQLGDLVTKVGSGVTPKGGSAAYLASGVPLIRSQNVLWGKLNLVDVAFISDDQHQRMANSALKPFDVLLNITGASIGRCAMVPKEFKVGNVNQHVCIIRPTAALQPEFLTQYLNSEFSQKQIGKLQAGGNREGLNFQQIRGFSIELPPLPEQQKIAAILTAVDDKLDVIARQIEANQTLKRGLMQTLFSRGVGSQDAHGRWVPHTEFRCIAGRILPCSWEGATLSAYIAELRSGVSVNAEDRPCEAGEIGVLKVSSVQGGKFVPTNHKAVVPGEISRVAEPVQKDSIIISRANTPALVGESAYIAAPWLNLFLPDKLWKIQPTTKAHSPRWLAFYLQSPEIRQEVRKTATGTSGSMKNISKISLLSIFMPLVPLEEQRHIADLLTSVTSKVEALEAKHRHYQTLKRGLMQKLLTGQWRVKPDNPGTPSPVAEAA